jgi:hypothetical protein
MWLMIFICIPNPLTTQHDPHGSDDPFRTTNYHHLDISEHDGMDEQDIGWRNGWCWMSRILIGQMACADEDFGSEFGQM